MESTLSDRWQLPPVKLAPFYALGLIASYYGNAAVRIALIAVSAAAFALLAVKKRSEVLCAAGLFVGVCVMMGYSALYCEPLENYGGKSVTAQCRITEVVSQSGDNAVYLARTKLDGRTTLVRLNGPAVSQVGDIITAEISFRNSAESEYRTLNLSRGILLSGYITEITSTEEVQFDPYRLMEGIRGRFKHCVLKWIGGDEGSLAMAMMFGDSGAMPLWLTEAARVSGVSHYTAVSGTHLAVFAAVLMELFGGEKKRMQKAVLSLLILPVSVLFFGISASVIRSAIMVALSRCAPLFLRRSDTLNSLCAAFLLMTAVNPMAALDAGLQMSVLGVFGVAVVGRELGEALANALPEGMSRLSVLVKAVSVSAGAVICTAPVSIACFGGISLLSAPVSLLIMPLFAATMAFMLLLGITALSIFALPLGVLLRIMLRLIGFFGDMRNLWIPMDFVGAPFVAALCAAAVVWAVAERDKRGFMLRAFAALSAFAMLMCLWKRDTRREIDFVSDGASGAAVVCVKNEAAVLICANGNRLAPKLAACLRENGITRIRLIAADGLDYSGALALGELAEIVPTERIYADESVRKVLESVCTAEISEFSSDSITVDDITLAAAKVSSDKAAEIVLYSGYTRSEPRSAAGLAVFCSSRQEIIPENGVNIYDEDYELRLETADTIIVNERVD